MAKNKDLPAVQENLEEPKAVATVSKAYASDAGAGFEDTDQNDYSIPFLGLVQSNSPMAEDEGVKPGSIFNTVTGEIFPGDEGVVFIPVHREHKYIEWVPRDAGGGFVAAYSPTAPEVIEAKRAAGTEYGKLALKDNDLVETFYVYGLLVREDRAFEPMVVSFSSTQIKAYKAWMTRGRSITLTDPDDGHRFIAPFYSHKYRLTTERRENKKGKWHGWKIGFASGTKAADSRIPDTDELYQAAKSFRDLVTSGAVTPVQEKQQQDNTEDPSQGDDF